MEIILDAIIAAFSSWIFLVNSETTKTKRTPHIALKDLNAKSESPTNIFQ